MKNKIFNRLKQEYAHLGLDDNFLLGLAESLANSGYVTDENIEGVVSAQKAYLESMQKSNDKRVQEAVDKAKKAAEDAQSAKIADLEKQLAEAKEKQTPPPSGDQVPDWYKAKEKEREEKEKAYQQQIDELKKAKEDADKAKAEAEAARVAAQRLESINKKAKEKGIPTTSSSAVSARFLPMRTTPLSTPICRSTPRNSRPTSCLARTAFPRARAKRPTKPRSTPSWTSCSPTARKRRSKIIV